MNVGGARTNLPEMTGGAVFEENLEKVESLRPLEDGRTLGQLAPLLSPTFSCLMRQVRAWPSMNSPSAIAAA
jgi:hypothetical protein